VLLLTPKEQEGEVSEMTKPAETVDIDISLTAYANAARQYEVKKKAQTKAQKTMDMADTAIKAAEVHPTINLLLNINIIEKNKECTQRSSN
jgi:hypothetical protein